MASCAEIKQRVSTCLGAMALLVASTPAWAVGNVVISQVYGGGGNSGATYQNDFVELFNRSASPVNITGWSVQYASAGGTGTFAMNSPVALSGTLQPGQYFLVRLAAATNPAGIALPAADTAATAPNLAAGSGKVALVNASAGLACNGSTGQPCSADQLAQIVDLVGYGTANFFENAPAATLPNNASAALRVAAGCTDTDNNSADFLTGTPTPRNSGTALNPCGGPVNQPIVPVCPTSLGVTSGVGAFANISASDADGFVSSAAITSAAVSGINLINVVGGAPLLAQLEVSAATAIGGYNVEVTFSNNDTVPQMAACVIAVSVAPPAAAARIREIQGTAHLSPRLGQAVGNVPGIVTAVRENGFYMQDPVPDSDPATSEGIFVFTSSAPGVAVGDSVEVSGTVAEFRAGGSGGLANLTLTEITSPATTILGSGNPLPAPVSLGYGAALPAGWRAIPTAVIDDDAVGDVETSGSFDAAADGIDFFESLEGMLVRIVNPLAVGPTNSFGEIAVLANEGIGAGVRTGRGGIVINSADFNPERLILDDVLAPTPQVNVGDRLSSVNAVVDYSFGNFKFYGTGPLAFTSATNGQEVTALSATPGRLTLAAFNVENLSAVNPAAKFTQLAGQIVNNLRSPDIVSLIEIQDNNGATNDAVVDAGATFSTLITAITAAGGPSYQFRNINPVDDQDGGEPGGNIRVGFLFNPARVAFVDRAGGTPTSATGVVSGSGGPELTASPGRIDPLNLAFASSRKPLAGEFLFNGRKLFVIANHFNSKGGDDPLFGRLQPPVRSSEIQRNQQATLVRNFVQSILAIDANARIVVAGDLNDFEFSDALTILRSGSGLVNMVEALTPEERYTYVFDGNSQSLDHALVSSSLAAFAAPEVDIVHMNAEFATRATDHDPVVIRLNLGVPGDVDGDGDIDRNDVNAITAARNTPASNPNDVRDLNGDGQIDALDARLAVNACTRPRCATN